MDISEVNLVRSASQCASTALESTLTRTTQWKFRTLGETQPMRAKPRFFGLGYRQRTCFFACVIGSAPVGASTKALALPYGLDVFFFFLDSAPSQTKRKKSFVRSDFRPV